MEENLSYGKAPHIAEKPIYITVPASVAFDLRSMNKVTEIVLGRLGCPGCHSGFDLRFDFERQFLFDKNLETH